MVIVSLCRYRRRRQVSRPLLYSELTDEIGEEPNYEDDVGMLIP